MINNIVRNPYDIDREAFVKICKSNIHFLTDVDDSVVRELYYRSTHHHYIQNEKLFDIGECCDSIIIIIRGMIDIRITDGMYLYETLDLLGPGSIIGCNYMLKKERWPYLAINTLVSTCRVMKISYKQI